MTLPYYLGLPLWSNAHWKGSVFPLHAKSAEFLMHYAQVFNSVEGNTTFYALPSAETVQRWCSSTPNTFRFSFKFPKTITHTQHLLHVQNDISLFLKRIEPLGERINGLMVQLPASFSPLELNKLECFLKQLPTDYHYAVEVRHPAFFTVPHSRAAYNALLESLQVDRVIFESRPMHAAPALDTATQEAQTRKPRLPVQLDTTAHQPVLRYIGHPIQAENAPWLDRWVAQTVRWLNNGYTPRIFMHTPSNNDAPALAQEFHQKLQKHIPSLPTLPLLGAATTQNNV